MTLADLLQAAKLLPRGSSITLSVDDLLAAVTQAGASAEPTSEANSRLLSVAEVALRLGVSKKYVYQHSKRWPFRRKLPGDKAVRFEERGLERWLARQV